MSSDVYGTATSGLRSRLASSLALRARRRRHRRFFDLVGLRPGAKILDVGCGTLGLLALAPDLDITGVDLVERPSYPGRFVLADATQRLPFGDNEFDLVYASSVIEHIPVDLRKRFAAEIRRVGRGWYVQTPAYSFPIEPHALLPFAHWMPSGPRRRYWRFGVAQDWEDVSLLRRGELESYFPGGEIHAERFTGLAKSWISVRRSN